MARMRIEGIPGGMGATITDIPAFPGACFSIGFPEAIGDAAQTCWPNAIVPQWEQLDNGVWRSTGRKDGELSYTLTLTAAEDVLDAHFALKNESDRTWAQSLAFNCFQCGGVPAVRDHECLRHWVRTGDRFRRLIEIPRVFGPRPAIQLYSVDGAPPGKDIPFVANFQATPNVVLEGWMAIQSRDGKRLVATASCPALFLFQNMEYSCIHSAAGFGPLKPGESARAINRLYFVEAAIDNWYHRLKRDLESFAAYKRGSEPAPKAP